MEPRESIPENYFSIWKDEAMIKWDRFIYNMKYYERVLTFPKLESFDDIIEFYRINFDIIITLEDIKERPYLFGLVILYSRKKEKILLPDNQKYETLIFYDYDFLLRLSNIYNEKIEKLIINPHQNTSFDSGLFTFIFLKKINVHVIRYNQTKFSSFSSMYDDVVDKFYTRSSDEEIENPKKLSVGDYDRKIENLESLTVGVLRKNVDLNDGLLFLEYTSFAIDSNIIFPDSLKLIAYSIILDKKPVIPEGLIDLSLISGDINVPKSLRSLTTKDLHIDRYLFEGLECLQHSNLEDEYILNLVNLRVLKVTKTISRMDLSELKMLDILISENTIMSVILPEKLRAICAETIKNTHFPRSLKLLSCVYYDNARDIKMPNVEFLSILASSLHEDIQTLPSSLIYLKARYMKKLDLNDFPNLLYLETTNKVKIENMRENIMITHSM